MRVNSLVTARHSGHVAGLFCLRFAMVSLALAALCILAVPATARGITTISQGFSTSDKLSIGSIVSLQKNSSDTVVAANGDNTNSILGVVINDGNSLLSLTSDKAHQIQVATSGIVEVLVSNINGDISQGDEITSSPINGVGMKATSSIKVVGIAQDALTGTHGSTQSYSDKKGQKHSVLLGEVPVLVNVSFYYKQPEKTIIPSAIQNIANALAGKPINPLPVLISMGIFIITLVVVVSIIYSMIRSSIISVGRNPMSQSAIYRDLIQLSALIVGILVVAVVSIYLVLVKF
jgi:hypothetical protein